MPGIKWKAEGNTVFILVSSVHRNNNSNLIHFMTKISFNL